MAPLVPVRLEAKTNPLYTLPAWPTLCLTCGSCAGACPISGVDDLDPRKIVRMAFLRLEEELVESDWPWKCTMCGKCEVVCPMNVEILQLMRRIRARCDRDKVPAAIQKGVVTCLEKGNNLGIPKDDFLLAQGTGRGTWPEFLPRFRHPGRCPRGAAAGDRQLQAAFCRTGQPDLVVEDLLCRRRIVDHLLRILGRGQLGLHSGDYSAMRTIVKRIIDNIERLNCKALLLPECGHAYYATRYALERWFPESLQQFKIYTIFDLLLEYLNEGRSVSIPQSARQADHLPRLLQLRPQLA
jgi:dimethylglycine catabolism B